jgi:Fe2+ or Zn2+ uptake regulation protein
MEVAAGSSTEVRLRTALEASGHRHTAQRAAIYRYLKAVKSHPTADEIFTQVREVLPDISLATVYKALEAFVEADVAIKLDLSGGPARYDGRTDDHDHVRCLRCGTVRDVVGEHDSDIIRGFHSEDGFEILDYRLELIGYCPNCRN